VDCILYIDLFFLWNFWMNALVLFLVRQITKTYRTIHCLLAAALGACSACFGLVWYIQWDAVLPGILLEISIAVVMNLLAFGAKNLLLKYGTGGQMTMYEELTRMAVVFEKW